MNRLVLYSVVFISLFISCIGEDVVEAEVNLAKVEITTPIISLEIGTSIQLDFQYEDQLGMEVIPGQIEWQSSDASVLSITQEGLLSADKVGSATIKLTVDNMLMDSITIEANEMTKFSQMRSGVFVGKNSYSVEGSCELTDVGGKVELRFNDDFRTSSGPGLYVYLSNSSTGVAGGASLGELKANTGVQTYQAPENITLNTYQFVHIYCQPFGVLFGTATLN
ncbi:hypothetical protein GCM10011506_32880 [Marivirga lumbricoides]|uniref:DM13 domain-containing protein n=1 Tax=Marivirga lumbricoides TaxID=1046115 RepID=A0ABQ1MQU1_9BACT|nr:hypothetical protein GCM10011506_32880 [Marivirga lumbricoides]